MKISFVIPCFNEENNIIDTIKVINTIVRKKVIDNYEIIVVDDGSYDNTYKKILHLKKKNEIIFIKHDRNQGFGAAYKSGVKRSSGEYVIMVPGDNAHSSEEITKILKSRGKADIIVPYSKSRGGRNVIRFLLSKLFTILVNTIFFLNVKYYNGLVLHKGNLIRNITIDTDGFTYQVYALVTLIKQGASVNYINVEVRERSSGKSSAVNFKNFIEVFKSIVKLRLKKFN